MKKILLVLIILGSVLVVAGAMFKILHYAGSDVLLLTGIACSAAAFIGFGMNQTKTKG